MREIRFRAYFEVETQDENTNPIIYGTTWEVRRLDFSYSYVELYDPKTGLETEASFDEIKLMQYTGLKDKNGKEIYEGDILELRANPFDRKKDLFQVVFKDGGFRDEWNNYIGQYLPPDIRNKQGGRVRLNEACEVVGNIYENPELLEEDKNA